MSADESPMIFDESPQAALMTLDVRWPTRPYGLGCVGR